MSIKSLVRGALVACLMLLPASSFAGSAGSTCTITETVDAFAEWSSATPSIVTANWDGHITATNQTRTAHVDLHLYANVGTTITASVGDATNGILTLGTQTLTTTYELTGSGLDTADSAYRNADANAGGMFHNGTSWTTTHTDDTSPYDYPISLYVQALSPTQSAVEPGDYSTTIILTASW